MIRVLIVDDSAVVCSILTDELSRFPDIQVVGTARDPYIAREKIVTLRPDVLTLDIEMPRMDGLSFLAKLMQYYPMPVVVVSSVAPRQSEAALRALLLGAMEVVSKPGSGDSVPLMTEQLVKSIRTAASARVMPQMSVSDGPNGADQRLESMARLQMLDKIVALGASTGGTRAIETVLAALPAECPGIVIVQHLTAAFTESFAARLNKVCAMEVREARNMDRVVPGVALVAPGGQHMTLEHFANVYSVRIKNAPPVHHQRPSVDVLFHSVARAAGSNAVGVLMTGMGVDGAEGLLAMKRSGAHTIAEHEDSCVIYGMPREAVELGAATEVVRLPEIAAHVMAVLERQALNDRG